MRVTRRIMVALLTTGLAMLMVGLALRVYMGSRAQDRLASEEAVNLTELRPPLPKAALLACPPNYCVAQQMTSPVFDMPWDRLQEYWQEMIGSERPMVLAATDPEHHRFVYIQHSPIFRFPDLITVEFVLLGSDLSSIALYSRSRYGEYDYAKNRKRVERWLVLLQKVAQPAAARSQDRVQ